MTRVHVELHPRRGADTVRSGSSALTDGVGVAICTYERPASLGRLLDSLRLQSRTPEHLLVIDGSHRDDTERMLRARGDLDRLAPRITYVRVDDAERGLTRQRNLALALASTDLLAFFDDDMVLDPACLQEMERPFRTDAAIVGVGAVIANQRQTAPPALWRVRRGLYMVSHLRPGSYCRSGMSIPWSFATGDALREGDWLPGGCTMWRTADASDVGFCSFFTGYAQGEDLDFSLRVKRRGRLVVAPSAQVHHLHDQEGRPNPFELGYMAIANRFQIQERGLQDRAWTDVMWFAYAWTLDTLLLARLFFSRRQAGTTLRHIAGRAYAALWLVRHRGRIAAALAAAAIGGRLPTPIL
jgi:GT2 family glycosyltransferase